MGAVLSRASRSFLRRHPWQLVLAIVGIALGVAVVTAIDLALESALRSFTEVGKVISGQATHRITGGSGGLDEALYRKLRVSDGFAGLSPVVSGYVKIGRDSYQLLGIDPFVEGDLHSGWRTQRGYFSSDRLTRLAAEPGAALVSETAARRLGVKAGGRLTIIADAGPKTLTVIGLLPPADAVSEQALAHLLIVDIATAQEILNAYGRLSSIEVLSRDDAGVFLKNLRAALPAGALLLEADSQADAVRELTRSFRLNLQALGLLSLLVGLFLIYNTATFLVVQRRPLIGRLRLLGVTRGQLFRLLLSEAFVLALAGAALGLLTGWALAKGLLVLIAGTLSAFYFHSDATALIMTPAVMVKAGLLGMGATLTAVLPPALEAACQPAAWVMARSRLEKSFRRLKRPLGCAGMIIVLAGAALAPASGKSIQAGLASVFLILFGFGLLTPVLTLLMVESLGRLLGSRPSILWRLPLRTVSAELSRTGVAIAALMIAVAATIGMDLMIGSFRQTVADWLKSTLAADFYFSLAGQESPAAGIDSARRLKSEAARLDGVKAVSGVAHVRVVANNAPVKVSVYELTESSRAGFIFREKADSLWRRFESENTLLITEPYAYRHNLHVGRTVALTTAEGERPFTVIGVYADYSGDQGHLAMSRGIYRRYWPEPGYSGIGVYMKPGADVQRVYNGLSRLAAGRHAVRSSRAIFDASMALFNDTFKITETLRWLSAAIAFAGVFGALMALQFERTRQLGVLRAVGLTRGQLARLIIGETGLMGLMAGVVALPVGLIMAYVLIFVVYQRSFGWTMAFHPEISIFARGLLIAVIAALLAGILPALKMARTSPAEAMRTE